MQTTWLKPDDIPEYYVMLVLPKTCIRSYHKDLTFYEVKKCLSPKIQLVDNLTLQNNSISNFCFALKWEEKIIGNTFFFKKSGCESLLEMQFCFNPNYGDITTMQSFALDCLWTLKNLINEAVIFTYAKKEDYLAVELIKKLGFSEIKNSHFIENNNDKLISFLWNEINIIEFQSSTINPIKTYNCSNSNN